MLDFGGRFALEPPRGNQHQQAARARLATDKPAVLRRHIPVWPVCKAAACGLTEAERAAIVGRIRRFGLSGRAGISSKCEIPGELDTHTDARSAKKDVISTKPQKAMGAERTFPREDKRKGFAPSPCAVTLAKCRRNRGTLSCANRASEGGGHSHLSCVRVVTVSSLGEGPNGQNI